MREGHPYIKIYNEFRRMFGSANILTVIIEMKHGDIYNPTTLQKVDQVTKALVETKGVVPYQILSIAHPKMKSITNAAGRDPDPRGLLPGGAARPGGRRSRQVRGLLHQGHPRPLRLGGRHRRARAPPASGRRSSTSTTSTTA